jgi:hypothetical protein
MYIPVNEDRLREQIFSQAAGKIIVYRYPVPPFKKFLRYMAADIPGTAYDQDIHADSITEKIKKNREGRADAIALPDTPAPPRKNLTENAQARIFVV